MLVNEMMQEEAKRFFCKVKCTLKDLKVHWVIYTKRLIVSLGKIISLGKIRVWTVFILAFLIAVFLVEKKKKKCTFYFSKHSTKFGQGLRLSYMMINLLGV